MKIRSIEPNIRITDLENFFNIFKDKRGNYVYNLNETLYLNIGNLKEYKCDTKSFWPLISYKIYGTPRMSWLLMKVNNVNANEIFHPKQPGDIIKYPDKETVNSILKYICDM